MKKGGRLVSTVAQIEDERRKNHGVNAVYMGVKPDFEDMKEITTLIEEGRVKTDVAQVFPLVEAAKAWDIFNHKAKPRKNLRTVRSSWKSDLGFLASNVPA